MAPKHTDEIPDLDAPPAVGSGANKRKKQKNRDDDETYAEEFYRIGKEVQNRSGMKLDAESSEDRRFREFFGCGVLHSITAWNLIISLGILPPDGLIIHLLWALYFMKCYPKTEEGCAAMGGSEGPIDPKTMRKFVWPFIKALAGLEDDLVSILFQ